LITAPMSKMQSASSFITIISVYSYSPASHYSTQSLSNPLIVCMCRPIFGRLCSTILYRDGKSVPSFDCPCINGLLIPLTTRY
jgi:hypothetical protein